MQQHTQSDQSMLYTRCFTYIGDNTQTLKYLIHLLWIDNFTYCLFSICTFWQIYIFASDWWCICKQTFHTLYKFSFCLVDCRWQICENLTLAFFRFILRFLETKFTFICHKVIMDFPDPETVRYSFVFNAKCGIVPLAFGIYHNMCLLLGCYLH